MSMGIFDYDSGFSRLLRKVGSCLVLNALWLVGCLPVITAGASSTAFYDALRKNVLREEGYAWSGFWRSFRENFKPATLCWLVFLAAGAFLGWDLWYFLKLWAAGSPEGMLAVVIAVMLAVLLLTAVYTFAYIARFEDRTGRTLKNALLLALTHPLVNLRILILAVLMAASALMQPAFLIFLPAVSCWLICLSMEKIFARIAPETQKD